MFLLLAAALVAQQPAGTGLRGTGDFVVLATSDEAELLAACVQVSPAYEDSMTLQVFDASGALVSRDVVAAGASKMLRLTKSSGPYQVSCSAGRNAVRLAVQGGAVILDARSSGALALYGSLQPLYFSVQRAGRLELDIYAEEPAELALYAPDGTALWRDAIPDHTQRKVALEVKPEWVGAGKLLRLTGKLEGDVRISLDPAIIPLFADGDAAGQILAELRGGLPTTDLDGRLCALSVAQAGSMARVAARLRAADGLTIDLSPEGEIVACGTQPAALRLPRPRGGFAVRDHSVGGKISFGRGSCKAIGERAAEILVQFEGTPYSVRATVTAEEARVLVRGEVASAASEDRPITLMCLIPAPGAEQWFDDIDTARVPLAGASMCKWVPSGAGAVGRVSCYPLGCVAGGPLLGESGLAVAVPLDLPRVFRISYASQPGALVVAFDVGLTPDTRKFPNRATFAVELFRTDRAWGFRDALRRYYALHPVDFQRQIPKIGGWVCWGNLESVPDFADYGFQYHWGPGGVPAVKFDDEHGVYSFLYNDSVRYFADLGEFEQRPTLQQANAVFERLLTTDDPRSFILSRPPEATGRRRYEGLERSLGREAAERWLRDSLEAARRSVCLAPDGSYHIGYIINRKDWGPPNVNWWTGRLFCNPDPEIPGGYGNFLIERIISPAFAEAASEGAHYDGVGLDNYFVYAQMVNCRREHFAYLDHPPSFDHATLKLGAVGDFLLWEWVVHLRQWLRERDMWLIANQGHWPYPFAAPLLDIHGFEWGIQQAAPIARALAYHKPVVSLPLIDEHYQEPFIRDHVRFAFIPGGYATREFAERAGLRELYRKYVPAILACVTTGWEPVTYARTDNDAVKVERFGQPPGRILLSVVNTTGQPQRATLTADAKALRLPLRPLAVRTLVSGQDVNWRPRGDAMVCRLLLEPHQADVVALAE